MTSIEQSMVATAAAIAILRDAYPRQPFPDESVAFYARKLSDLPADELVPAVDRLTNRCTFLPSVAEIRREVAEARLELPSVMEAWEWALRGNLREAPEVVRQAAEDVGGRWALLHGDDRASVVRSHFWRSYEDRREAEVLTEMGAMVRPELGPSPEKLLPLPAPDHSVLEVLPPPAVLRRELKRLAGERLEHPTEEEMQDAIAILRAGPMTDDPAEDNLYAAAERVLDIAGR